MQSVTRRLHALDSLRGIAAFVVFVSHFALAFAPNWHGLLSQVAPTHGYRTGLLGNPFYALVNGTAAVMFFFVLSGYVLARTVWLAEATSRIAKSRVAVVNILKRWPRLALLSTITTALSAALFLTDSYYHLPAALVSHSLWLSTFAGAQFPAPFEPSLWDGFVQGSWRTFWFGEGYYNTNLWTLRYELVGSVLVFASAAILTLISNGPLRVLILLFIASIAFLASIYYGAFAVGLAIAIFEHRLPKLSSRFSAAIVVVALWALGYYVNFGAYQMLPDAWNAQPNARLGAYLIGSVLLIWAFGPQGGLNALLTRRWNQSLGKVSFALYLVHTPIIMSFSSWFFIETQPYGPVVFLGANFVLTAALTLSVSLWLSILDERWIGRLNRTFRR